MKFNMFLVGMLSTTLFVFSSNDASILKADESISIEESLSVNDLDDLEVIEPKEIDVGTLSLPSNTISGISLKQEEVKTQAQKAYEREMEYCAKYDSNVPNYLEDCRSYFYSYESYTAITSTSSPQYRLLRGSDAYTDSVTGIRMVGDRYCIAVGTYYAQTIGTKLDVVMENGNIFKCIVGDFKSDSNTDSSHRYHVGGMWRGKYYEGDGSVIEFIIDRSVFYSTSQYPSGLEGNIQKIVPVE